MRPYGIFNLSTTVFVTKSRQFCYCHIPCGLVARIRHFHRRGRGSIPRKGGSTFLDTISEKQSLAVGTWLPWRPVSNERALESK